MQHQALLVINIMNTNWNTLLPS